MKQKLLPFFLTIALGANTIPTTIFGAEFKDIISNPYNTEIERWADEGILFGMTDDEFEPNGTLTRAQMAAILNRVNVYKAQSSNNFTDIKSTDWFYLDILKANAAEVFVGNGNGTMTPNVEIDCESAVAAFARAFGVPDSSTMAYPGVNVSSWAVKAVNGMKEAGYLDGLFEKGFNPKRAITRAETVKLLDNCLTNFIKTKGTVTSVSEGNVLINTSDVTLKDVTINGNLIIAEGVGEGDVVLDNIKVTGKTIIRGGGANSVVIQGGTKLSNVDVYKHKQTDDISIKVNGANASIDTVNVLGNSENVHIYGNINNVNVNDNAKVYASLAIISNCNLVGENSGIILDNKSNVKNITVNNNANDALVEVQKGSKVDTLKTDAVATHISVYGAIKDLIINKTAERTFVEVEQGAVINKVNTAAPEASIRGKGRVEYVTVSGNDTKIYTPGTSVTVTGGATGVTANAKPVASGQTVTVDGSMPSVDVDNKETTNNGNNNTGNNNSNYTPSSNANLSTASKIKGVKITNMGTPSSAIENVAKGSVTLTAEQALLTTGTDFIKSSIYASVKTVKYPKSNALPTATEFTNATAFKDTDTINDGDFFVIKVTAEDGTIKYYIVDVVVESNGEQPTQKSATPATNSPTVIKTQATQSSVDFTLTNAPTGTWKVYNSETSTNVISDITVNVTGNTLTLTHSTDIPANDYYVSVTESGKIESDRLKLTVYNNSLSTDATLLTTSAIKNVQVSNLGTPSSTIADVVHGNLTLTTQQATSSEATYFNTSDVNATVKIVKYAQNSSTNNFENDTAFNNNDTTPIVNGDFFVIKVTAQDGVTVKYYIIDVVVESNGEQPTQKSATPTTNSPTVIKTQATQSSVNFTLTNAPTGIWKVYNSETGTNVISNITVSVTGSTLTLTHSTDIPASDYYVSVTESGKLESDRLKLTVYNNSLSDDATLLTTSAIKNVQVSNLGTPSNTVTGVVYGNITLTTQQATSSEATYFNTNSPYATIKVVKYAQGDSIANFENDTVFNNNDTTPIANGDFFVIKVTAQDGVTINYYIIDVTVPNVNDATLLTTSAIKNVQVSNLGTPSSTIAGVVHGNLTLTTQQATASEATYFNTNSPYATIKIVKYAQGDSTNNFENDTAFDNNDTTNPIANGDFFVIKVTAEDGVTINYYIVDITV